MGGGDSRDVFDLRIRFFFLIVRRLFTVSGFNFIVCSSVSSKPFSASSVLDGEFPTKGTKLKV